MTNEPFRQWGWVDRFLIPALMAWLMFEPNWLSGRIDYLEVGQYLGPINSILHGGRPYVDWFTQHGPLFLYLPAALMALFGKTIAVLRIYFHVANILGLLIAYGVGCLVCKGRPFRWLIAWILVVEAFHPFWSIQWGGFRIGADLLVLWCLIRYVQGGRRKTAALAGFLSGLALLYSTEVGLFSLATGAALFLGMALGRTVPVRILLRDSAGYALGCLGAVIPVLAYFAVQGALVGYVTAAWWILPTQSPRVWSQVGNIPSLAASFRQAPSLFAFIAGDTFKIYLPGLLYPIYFVYVAVKIRRQRRVTPEILILGLLIFHGSLLYLASFRAVLASQFQMAALPLVIILSVLFIEKCYNRLRASAAAWRDGRPARVPALLTAAALILSAAYLVGSEKRYYGTLRGWFLYQRFKPNLIATYTHTRWPAPGEMAPLRCERGGAIRVPRWQAEEMDGVTQFLKEHTAPGETVFAFPEHGIFNFLADRPGLSRFDIAALAGTIPAWRAELLNELQSHPPRYVIVGRFLSNLAGSIRRKEEMLPEVIQYLKRHYRLIRIYHSVDLLERTDAP